VFYRKKGRGVPRPGGTPSAPAKRSRKEPEASLPFPACRGGQKRDLDAPGDQRRVDVAGGSDRFKGHDHAGHRAEKAHQGRDVGDRGQNHQAALQEAQLDRPGRGDYLLEFTLVDREVADPAETRQENGRRGARSGRSDLGRFVQPPGHGRLFNLFDHRNRLPVSHHQGPELRDDDPETDE